MTIGISPKAKLAALLAALVPLVGVGAQWLVTGEFDRAELATALTGLAAAALAFLGAYLGDPGDVDLETGPANDDLLPPAALDRMQQEPTPDNGVT